MAWRRVAVLVGKELREMRWMCAGFTLLAVVAISAGVALRAETGFRPAGALLDLVVVSALFSLLLAERQGADLRTKTRRHLLSFPVQPLEVVAGKAVGYLLCSSLLVSLGVVAYTLATLISTQTSPGLGSLPAITGRVVLFTLACWSMELAIVSWPRVGLAAVLMVVAAYAFGLAFVPLVQQVFNVFRLALLWVDGVTLLGPAATGALLAWFGLVTAACGLQSRSVEE